MGSMDLRRKIQAYNATCRFGWQVRQDANQLYDSDKAGGVGDESHVSGDADQMSSHGTGPDKSDASTCADEDAESIASCGCIVVEKVLAKPFEPPGSWVCPGNTLVESVLAPTLMPCDVWVCSSCEISNYFSGSCHFCAQITR